MKSIKPGRGPSFFNGVMSLVVTLFGVFWTVMAASFEPFMALFGIAFVGIGIYNIFHHFRNAAGKNRTSLYDITEEGEEPDPFETRFGGEDGREQRQTSGVSVGDSRFCPYCGSALAEDFVYCNRCGKKLP
ncbi:MAG: zinc ribbon domain-containing protein [Ruminococcaceae bacterium]|nr:zinc ribbon domain-containing protein [Oscillospiraceae bacterium]